MATLRGVGSALRAGAALVRRTNGFAGLRRHVSLSTPNQKSTEKLQVGLVQIAPVWLDRERSLSKVVEWTKTAAEAGCQLIVFGETLIPGYPFWLAHTNGAKFNSTVQKIIHARYLREAVDISAGHLDPLCEVAKRENVDVMVGCYERPRDRGGHSGYCSLVSINRHGIVHNVHRKLVPTYEERLSWANGDGHGLRVFQVGPFTVGGLNCWENWMPLPRASLYAQGENLHIAVWPGSARNTHDITRYIARESRSYVVSVSGLLRREDIPESMPERDVLMEALPPVLANGGSCVAGPDGYWIIEPTKDKETMLTAMLDLTEVYRERQNFDPSGHYSRPDVLQLRLNRERQSVLGEWNRWEKVPSR